jgi:hypothetical protein
MDAMLDSSGCKREKKQRSINKLKETKKREFIEIQGNELFTFARKPRYQCLFHRQ